MLQYDRHNWVRHLFTLKGSVLPIVMPRILVFAGLSIPVVAAHKLGWAPTIPPTIHAVLGTVLGLMLAFRTNSAYDRWWEGRRAWGTITNRTRDLARQGATFFEGRDLVVRNAKLLAAFAHATKRQLWRERDVPELEALLGELEARAMTHPPGPSQRLLLALGEQYQATKKNGQMSEYEYQLMDRNLTELHDQLGVCQRIQKTPIPFAYVVHLKRFLLVYNLTLPFALVADLGYGTPLIMVAIGYAMFGVEEIGVRIEDPFLPSANDIDLERVARNIERDVLATAGAVSAVPESAVPAHLAPK